MWHYVLSRIWRNQHRNIEIGRNRRSEELLKKGKARKLHFQGGYPTMGRSEHLHFQGGQISRGRFIPLCILWTGAPSCYFKLLDKLQKQICRTVGPSFAASLESLAHLRNVASLRFFCMYYFVRCSSELAKLVPLPYSRGRSTRYSDRLHDFFVTISCCYKDIYVNVFFSSHRQTLEFSAYKMLSFDLLTTASF